MTGQLLCDHERGPAQPRPRRLSSRSGLRPVTEGTDSLDLKAGPNCAGGVWLNELKCGVMMRITLDVLNLANLGETVPPRDPDDDDEAEDEENDERDDDLDPPVIREPDE
jgi:hypothetical protein